MTRQPTPLPVPAWLTGPPSAYPSPPVQTNKQYLPLGELEWKDFERLCLRLARVKSDIEDCRVYGVQGDDQEGIDLFARASPEGYYRVYQCKKEVKFSAGKIARAVDIFLAGEWCKRAKEFYLCAIESFAGRPRADELIKQRERLAQCGIRLVTWDLEEICLQLKAQPELVDDFFGRAWVSTFLGEPVASQLSPRLDIDEQLRLRRHFAKLYLGIFRNDDPTYSFRDLAAPGALFPVLPDVVTDASSIDSLDESHTRQTDRETPAYTPFILEEEEVLVAPPPLTAIGGERIPVARWLASHESVLVVGGPGAGKSTLLRIIALDLLSSSPQLEDIGRRWGNYLPVWIPFAFWTAMLVQDGSARASLFDAIVTWLELHGSGNLVPLVTRALETQRILLLVDGLDEWETKQAARNGLALLRIFASLREIPVIATCRPRAFAVLGQPPPDWATARLAPLSATQQSVIANGVLLREMAADKTIDGSLTAARTKSFLKDVSQRLELAELARTPLLLVLLAQLWHREEYLPENRFKAYDKLIELLVITHPIRRTTSARVKGMPLAVDLRPALSVLAFEVLKHHSSGAVARVVASRILTKYFADEDEGLALPLAEAKRTADEVLEHATDRAALLVARSPIDVGFYHRALLEHLAAEALARKDRVDRLAFVREHAGDSEWHEVIVALASLTTAREDVRGIVEAIRSTQHTAYEKLVTLPLLASIAFTVQACPPQSALQIAREVLDEIEVGAYLPIRLRLVEEAVRGLRSGPVQALVRERLEQWLPRRGYYRNSVYKVIASWQPITEDTVECLWRGLHDEDVGDVREAAGALVALAESDAALGERLLHAARQSPLPRLRAVILNALLVTRTGLTSSERIAITGITPRGELALVGIKGRVQVGEQSPDDLDLMLAFASFGSDLDYRWRDELDATLVAGWGGSDRLREIAMRSLLGPGEGHIDPNVARRVLIRGFLSRDDVSQFLAAEIRSGPPRDFDVWPLYSEFARDSLQVRDALDAWLPTASDHPVEAHWAARTTRSDVAKAVMIAGLERSSAYWSASALLQVWGINDAQVAPALHAVLDSTLWKSRALASILPEIIADRNECRQRLLAILTEPGNQIESIIAGLASIRSDDPEPDVVSRILIALEEANFINYGRSALIANWADDPRVEDLANQYLIEADCDLAVVATAARRAPKLRAKVLRALGVVPVRLRLALAEQLEGWRGDPCAAARLQSYPWEPNGAVRTQCAIAHHALHENQGAAAIDLLRTEVVKTGLVMTSARDAAFAALLKIGRLDVFLSATEGGLEPGPARLRSGWSRGYNGPFWKTVAEHWSILKATLKSDLFRRITDSESGTPESWEALATVAHHSSELSADVVERAVSTLPQSLGANTLRVLVRELGNTRRVRDILIESVTNGTRTMWWGLRYKDAGIIAAELLADTFGGDEETLQALASLVPTDGIPAVLPLLALCTGWSTCEKLEGIFQHLYVNRIRLDGLGHGAVAATKSRPEFLTKLIARYDDYSAGLRGPELRVVTRLMVRRLRDDDESFDRAFAARSEQDGANRITHLCLLVAARGLSELRGDAEQLVRRGLDGDDAPIVLRDPFSGSLSTASSLLLNRVLGR